jgi:hypothetical protein
MTLNLEVSRKDTLKGEEESSNTSLKNNRKPIKVERERCLWSCEHWAQRAEMQSYQGRKKQQRKTKSEDRLFKQPENLLIVIELRCDMGEDRF